MSQPFNHINTTCKDGTTIVGAERNQEGAELEPQLMSTLGIYLSEMKHYNYIDLEQDLAFQGLYAEDESTPA